MAAQWCVVNSKPNKEMFLLRHLQSAGYEVFFPRFLSQTGKLNLLKIKPYFPGYLLLKVDLDEVGISYLDRIPYSNGLVCWGDKPAIVPEELVRAIQKRLLKLNFVIDDLLNSSEPSGWTAELESKFAKHDNLFNALLPGEERVKTLLMMLQEINIPAD